MNLEGLNPEQKQAVTQVDGPLLVLAGAGSGKTRVLTHRIAYLIEEKDICPWNILALTFTNKAAREMRERVDGLVLRGADAVWIFTFHGFCARLLSREGGHLGFEKALTIFDDADTQSLIGRIIRDLELNDRVYTKRMLAGIFSDAKNNALSPAAYLQETGQPRQVLDAFALYQKRLRQCNAADFDDLLHLTLKLFAENPEVLAAYQEKFQYILVDEYQDTNLIQYRILELLAQRHRNLFVVGDDDQSIYGWRGADIRNILEFEKDFPGAGVIRLERNYRSTAAILKAANAVIENNTGRKGKTLRAHKGGGKPVSVHEAEDERAEAIYICNQIANAVRAGARYDAFAILYRTHVQSRILEMYLQGYSIPYRVYGGISFFARAEVKDVLAYLRLIYNSSDNEAFLRIVNVPKRAIGPAAIAALTASAERRDLPLLAAAMEPDDLPPAFAAKFKKFTALLEEAFVGFATRKLSDFTSELLLAIGYDAYLREYESERYESRTETVQELIGYMQEFEQNYEEGDPAVLQDFLTNVALFSNTDQMDEKQGVVSLMTLHAAKGLEFSRLFLCGLEDGLFPSERSRYDRDKLEEERRLCYVGFTRAMDELTLTYARRRMMYGRISDCMPSMFLKEARFQIPDSRFQTPIPFNGTSRAPSPTYTAAGASPRPTPPVVRETDFTVGEKVRHKVFGLGQVISLDGSGTTRLVQIRFSDGQIKKFAAAYAPIDRVES
ncbi:MAG: UvrD-helicase domain-containing protein [Clostridiales bacterium]|nr:UvrD-helicase domain-containing protein [Clostridiales bacterium]